MHPIRLLVLLALPVALLAIVAAAQQQPEVTQERQLPKLFDFQNYKRVFGKVYKSFGEELSRRRLVMARALRAFVSGIKYKFRQSNSYLALNHLSDKTPEERERQVNRVMRERSKRSRLVKKEPEVEDKKAELPELIPGEHEDVEGEISDYLHKHGHELGLDGSKRQKRDTLQKLRDFSLDQLINKPAHTRGKASPPTRTRIASNNPDYVPIEAPSFGLNDQQREITWRYINPKDNRPINEQLSGVLNGIKFVVTDIKGTKTTSHTDGTSRDHKANGNEDDDNSQDLLYVDHRKCMNPPRDQGECGACYAFSGIAIMEWLYCTKKGVRNVAFSEQYIIDCGNGRYEGKLEGCEGGSDDYVAQFVHNFGLELLSKYPYLERDGRCPYDEEHDLNKTGYIRMLGMDRSAYVPVEHFPAYIKHAPIYVGVAIGDDFQEYGGGLIEAHDCGPDAEHAMVVVGSGRHEGHDYYIVRNSFGTDWGEGGYMRVAHRAAWKCFENTGNSLGSLDGINFPVKPRKTKALVKKRAQKEDNSTAKEDLE